MSQLPFNLNIPLILHLSQSNLSAGLILDLPSFYLTCLLAAVEEKMF